MNHEDESPPRAHAEYVTLRSVSKIVPGPEGNGKRLTCDGPPGSIAFYRHDRVCRAATEAATGGAMISIIDAPSVLGLFPRGVQELPDALHRLDIGGRLHASRHLQLTPPPYSSVRDPISGIDNAAEIVSFARTQSEAVGNELDAAAFPLVLGGDCTVMLGSVLALARRGRPGMLFLDGHADFAHAEDEPSGEAASMDLALATGRGPDGFGPIGTSDPLIDDDRVAVLGYRSTVMARIPIGAFAYGTRPSRRSTWTRCETVAWSKQPPRRSTWSLTMDWMDSGSTSMSMCSMTISCQPSTTEVRAASRGTS